MTRVVGYVRISKADRDKTEVQQRLSIRAQRDQIEAVCEARGFDLVEVFEDFAASGADDDRVSYKAVLDLVATKGADAVIVTRLDRLSRKAWRLLYLVDEVGLRIIATEQGLDTGNNDHWLTAAITSVIADHERRLIGARTSTALRQMVREGREVGRKTGASPAARARIRQLAGQGHTPTEIARVLTDEGHEREDQQGHKQTTWTHKHVQRVLRLAVAA